MAGSILESKLVIGADDKTGAVFTAVEGKINRVAMAADKISKISGAIGNVGAKVESAAASFETMSLNVERVETRVNSLHRAMKGIGHVAASAGAAIAAAFGVSATGALIGGVKATSSYEGALARLKYGANATPEELEQAQHGASALPKKYPNIASQDVIETYSELIGALQHREEVGPSLEPAIAFKSAMQTNGKDASGESMRNILKAADLLNQTTSPKKLQDYLDAILRVKQIEGTLLTTEQIRDFARRAGAARFQLSSRFLTTTAPSLIGEQGGGSVGAAMSQISDFFSGKALEHRHAAIASLLKYGLLDKGDVLTSKKGDVTGLKPAEPGNPHRVKGWLLGQTDPDLWVQKFFDPAMQKAGVTDDLERSAILSSFFNGKNAPGTMALLDKQRGAFAQQAANYAKAGGQQGAQKILEHDPAAAAESAIKALENAFVAATHPLMEDFAPAAKRFAEAVNAYVGKIGDFATKHPGETAAMLGAGALGVVGGVGMALKAGADYFASRIGAAIAGNAVTNAAAAAATRSWASVFLPSSLGAGAAAAGLAGGALLASTTAANAGEDERARQLRYGQGAGAGKRLGEPLSGATLHPELLSAALQNTKVEATAKLDGQANINVNLSVDAPPELLALLRAGVSTTAFGDVRADTGTSRPDAAVSAGPGR